MTAPIRQELESGIATLGTPLGLTVLRWAIGMVLVIGLIGCVTKGADNPPDPYFASTANRTRLAGFGETKIKVERAGSFLEWCLLLAANDAQRARGLMQVLPGTGKRVAREAGVGRPYTSGKLYQPETNIALGIHYMTELLERYPGRIELMLAAYNAGENRVERWLEDFGNVNLPEFVERIPFSETRGYVKQVLTNAAHYRRITAVLRDAAQ